MQPAIKKKIEDLTSDNSLGSSTPLLILKTVRIHLRLMMNDGRRQVRNQVMNLLSLGGFLFHYLEVKRKL